MNQFRLRLIFAGVVLALGAAAVVARLFAVQVLHGAEYATRSREQSQQRCLLPAQRGTIYDRCGRVLAASTQGELSLAVDVLGARPADAEKILGIKRVYPLGEAEGAVAGYIGRDGYGLGGAEFAFDKYLRGEDGWTILERDGRNRRYRRIGLPGKEPCPGSAVYLTIDAEIQKIAWTVLHQTVTGLRAKRGMAMVMEPSSGRVLAMAGTPSFDPNNPAGSKIDRRDNGCISVIFEPGSTFKLITAAAALQDSIKREHDVLDGNRGTFEIYHETIRDHEPYGKLTFSQALAHSSNVCFAKIATAVGSKRLYRFACDFGFGSRTGIELPGEECGIVHPIRKWSGRTLVTMGIGQEVSVTMLQMMAAYAAVANGGVLVRPQICEKIVDPDGKIVRQAAAQPIRRVVAPETARRLSAMLQTVVDSGTGKMAAVAHVAIAGKTGTAQKIDSAGYSKTRSYVSFIGFMPADKPCLVAGIVIDEPAANLMAATAAAPAFSKIVTQMISNPRLEYAELILNSGSTPREGGPGAGPAPAAAAAPAMSPVRPLQAVADSGAKAGVVPDCVGRDARDAVTLVSRRGLVPFVIGGGTVRRQSPAAGITATAAQPCTLVCSFGG